MAPKSCRNRSRIHPAPDLVLEELGADALRAYLINSPIVRAEPLRFSKEGVREIIRSTLLPLVNSWSFFTQYANVDGWTVQEGLKGHRAPSPSERPELDRWLLSHAAVIGRRGEHSNAGVLFVQGCTASS